LITGIRAMVCPGPTRSALTSSGIENAQGARDEQTTCHDHGVRDHRRHRETQRNAARAGGCRTADNEQEGKQPEPPERQHQRDIDGDQRADHSEIGQQHERPMACGTGFRPAAQHRNREQGERRERDETDRQPVDTKPVFDSRAAQQDRAFDELKALSSLVPGGGNVEARMNRKREGELSGAGDRGDLPEVGRAAILPQASPRQRQKADQRDQEQQ
jgi:hypothetical protein